MTATFRNDDSVLLARVEELERERARLGLLGLVGGLETVVFGVEPQRLKAAAKEFLDTTGYFFGTALTSADAEACVLRLPGSADFLLRARTTGTSPFDAEPLGPKSAHLPHTRIETLVFQCHDLHRFVALQKARGVRFLSPEPIDSGSSLFIQTEPSAYSALSYGFVQWLRGGRQYQGGYFREADWCLPKPDRAHLRDIGVFDHASVRVHARDRDNAILEFLALTSYDFALALYVEHLNSITNVARFPGDPYAMVITSGLGDVIPGQEGPTEMFIKNYGRRVHHLAFRTEHIRQTFAALKAAGMEFLVELVGSPEEGLRQTFSRPLENTLMVHEYIKRYAGFDGFFTKDNVTLLTKATENQ